MAASANMQALVGTTQGNTYTLERLLSEGRHGALFEAKLMVHSAHIATYGERAVDTFYVTDLLGEKVDSGSRLKAVEKRLLEAADEQTIEVAA